MNNNFIKKNKGFTLVELLIVIAIIGIMSAVSIVSLQNGKTEKEVETAATQVAAAIREAQNNALTGKKNNGETPCDYVYFRWISNSNYAISYEEKVSEGICSSIKDYSVYTLENDVIVSSFDEISFSIPFGGTDISGTEDIVLSKDSNIYHVCVTSSGSVTEGKDEC